MASWKRHNLKLGLQMSWVGMLYKLKMNSGCIIVTFRSGLERQWKMKIFPVGRTVRGVPVHLLYVEEVAWAESTCRFLTNSQWPGCLERKCTGKSETRRPGVEIFDGPMGVGMRCDNLCVIYNAHQKASTTEEALNYQVDKLTQPIDISQPLSSATLEMAWWAHEWSGHGNWVGGYRADLATTTSKCLTCQQ